MPQEDESPNVLYVQFQTVVFHKHANQYHKYEPRTKKEYFDYVISTQSALGGVNLLLSFLLFKMDK